MILAVRPGGARHAQPLKKPAVYADDNRRRVPFLPGWVEW